MELLSSLRETQKAQKNLIEGKNELFYTLLFLLKRSTRSVGLRFLYTIWSHFFAPQLMTKYKLRKRPVAWIDHPLDKKIPFQPHHVSIYLSFTSLWLKSIGFVYREFGTQALPDIIKFVKTLTSLYLESSKVYLQIQSTTNRPRYIGGFYFKVIHLFDPHLHCIPSLHVEIVGLNYTFISSLIDKYARNPSNYQREKDYLWRKAVLITNSILLIKQHSVSCVAAGLFTLAANNYPFSEEDAEQIISALFTGTGNTLPAGEEIRTYIRRLYHHFLDEYRYKTSSKVLVDFLKAYPRKKRDTLHDPIFGDSIYTRS
ncbi:MAG: hypothetical protein ACOC2R_02170 [Spirochaetota bacterium]